MKYNKYNKAIAIIGPTSVGKTDVAIQLAKKTGVGEMVNMDKMFLFKHFRIASGLTDVLKEKNIKKHLYELLEPDDEIIPSRKYIKMVQKTCFQVLSKGGLPIIEGGSTTYVPAFLEMNNKKKFCQPVIGLHFPDGFNVRNKVSKRVGAALEMGLLEEVKRNLKKYRNTLGMLDGYVNVPLVRYLDGVIGLNEAKEEIIDLCAGYVQRQMNVFTKYSGITWLEYKPTLLSQTVKKIMVVLRTH